MDIQTPKFLRGISDIGKLTSVKRPRGRGSRPEIPI